VVTTSVDGYPQRVIRTELVDHLEGAGRITALPRSMVNALKFRKLSGRSLDDLAREGLAMKKNQGLTWAQVAMAGNAPMLTKAALVDGRLDTGVLPTGQVVGLVDELPTVAEIIGSIMEEAEATLSRLEGNAR
jgi:NAD(P)H-dependent flavin oxidoreductase YrpB (nitropropane dioxygenase family)